ncbi:MAG: SDR family NAD(P)-dependent oxidoreductase [Immundisolibacterales bacterium]|nr:SDR family NAD(P)-dependent oxidoreductase [Immundisolibacterales bacterium]
MTDTPVERGVAVVTGAARGIGRGCARALARKGFSLVLVDVLEGELSATAGEFARNGVQASPFVADVSDHGRARDVAAQVLRCGTAIDVLVNNAGTPMPKGLLEIEEHEWDRTIDVHMKGCFNWCRAVAPSMLARGAGRIINISSVSAYSGGVTSAVSKFAYAGAKAGILGMTRALAKELAPSVSVNAICPGAIKTELTAAMLEERSTEFIDSICLGRLGTPADIGEVAAFLATVEPNFITGQAITVDGFQWAT